MVSGWRTSALLAMGVLSGFFISYIFLPSPSDLCPHRSASLLEDDTDEHWEINIRPAAPVPGPIQAPKVMRARFAATELGIRDKLVVLIWAQSSLSVSLNATLSPHVTLRIFADASRIDSDMAQLPNLFPVRPNGQHPHTAILNSILNLTLHESYDWFAIVPDTTYLNPFVLRDTVEHINWNEPVVLGVAQAEDGHCLLDAGILISNPAMQALIQQRHLCHSIVGESDRRAFEICIHRATNLSCLSRFQGWRYGWWLVGEQTAIHESVQWLSGREGFNSSLAVSPLLTDSDVMALHAHFVRAKLADIDAECEQLESSIAVWSEHSVDGPSFPNAVPFYSHPPNRHQVARWDFFTETEIFGNEPNQNVRPLIGADREDVLQVIAIARNHAENTGSELPSSFVRLRNGYRMFDAMRGMDYMLDLLYRHDGDNEPRTVRVHLSRPIAHTQLMTQVPYVKEDTDVTVVVPVSRNDEVPATRRFIVRFVRLCQAAVGDRRNTRLVLAVRGIEAEGVRILGAELAEARDRCPGGSTDTALLLLRRAGPTTLAIAALDEAVDHYGQQMIYLLLGPHADFQREFLDRVRINTIKHFQAFFPIPFVEYHPEIVANAESDMKVVDGALINGAVPAVRPLIVNNNNNNNNGEEETGPNRSKNSRPLLVHKDQGHFDAADFSVLGIYGSDFVSSRTRLADTGAQLLDVISLFLAQSDVHVLRAVEPGLRIRFHVRSCDPALLDADYARCLVSRREGLASKAQLAALLLKQQFDNAKRNNAPL